MYEPRPFIAHDDKPCHEHDGICCLCDMEACDDIIDQYYDGPSDDEQSRMLESAARQPTLQEIILEDILFDSGLNIGR